VDDDSTVQRTFDSLDRLASETQGPNPLGGSGKTFAYAYNAAGSLLALTFPDGTVEGRARDAVERVSAVSLQNGPTLAKFQYAGTRVVQENLQNSVVRVDSFDALLPRTFVHYPQNAATLKRFEYVWNLADMRLLEKRHHANGTGDNYALDSLYRTVQVKAGVADPVAELQNPGSQSVQSTPP